ncbi:MAG: ATP synthase F1 subunit epsilon [Clostridia bacterium]|nr:ATP synthase F1 subunit epsilon [Clostridia bacterium]
MSTFHLTVSTPDGQLFDGDVQSLRLRMLDGDLGLLANHENYVAGVGAGEAVIVTETGDKRRAACIGGLLSMIENDCSLLPTTFEWAEDIDLERAQQAKARAEQRLAEAKEDKREIMLASAKLQRALVRIKVKS